MKKIIQTISKGLIGTGYIPATTNASINRDKPSVFATTSAKINDIVDKINVEATFGATKSFLSFLALSLTAPGGFYWLMTLAEPASKFFPLLYGLACALIFVYSMIGTIFIINYFNVKPLKSLACAVSIILSIGIFFSDSIQTKLLMNDKIESVKQKVFLLNETYGKENLQVLNSIMVDEQLSYRQYQKNQTFYDDVASALDNKKDIERVTNTAKKLNVTLPFTEKYGIIRKADDEALKNLLIQSNVKEDQFRIHKK